jgi:hypothetical protein
VCNILLYARQTVSIHSPSESRDSRKAALVLHRKRLAQLFAIVEVVVWDIFFKWLAITGWLLIILGLSGR